MIDLHQIFSIILLSGVFSFLIAFPVINILYKLNITRRMAVDISSLIEKRNLKVGVPIMGGLIVVISVVVLNLLFNPNRGIYLLLVLFILSAILGGLDDILNIFGRDRDKPRSFSRTIKLIKVHKSKIKRVLLVLTLPWSLYKAFFYMLGSNPGKGIQAHEKIIVQSIVGIGLGIALYYFTPLSNPELLNIPILNTSINIGLFLIPFTWITTVLMTNAVNLADGMDSLAANQLLYSFVGFLVIALLKEDIRSVILIATIIGSILSYIYFNIPPARFQMGDIGSLSLGTLLASVAFILQEPLMLLIISLPFAVTLLSTVIQGIGRRVLGRRIFAMAPIHYHFQMKYGWSEEKVVMRLTLFSIACMVIGIWIYTL